MFKCFFIPISKPEINRGFAPIGTPLDFAAPVGARQGVTAPRVVLLVAAPVVAHKSSGKIYVALKSK